MRTFVMAVAAVLLMSTAAPAQTAVSPEEALDIAKNNGVEAESTVEFDRGYWRIEGFDRAGRRVVLEVDATSGVVLRR